MTKTRKYALRLNPEYTFLVCPKSSQARKRMEGRLLKHGCSLPIRAWENTVLVDHEEYLFCRKNNIPIKVEGKTFSNQEEVIAWICQNQLRRKDLSEEMKKYLIGRRTKAEIQIEGRFPCPKEKLFLDHTDENAKDLSVTRLWRRLGAEYGLSYGTIRVYALYADAIDHINAITPRFAKKILAGNAKISRSALTEIMQMSKSEIERLSDYFLNEANANPSYIKYKQLLAQLPAENVSALATLGGIKEMPKYDPDSEIASLSLTIPSWISSIQRAQANTDFHQSSSSARDRLTSELDKLSETINSVRSAIKETL